MDEVEQLASALLVLLVVVRLTREVRAALEPIPRWPAGTSAADADGTWVTPDEERDRWAKRGAPPGGKRLATSVTAAVVALMAIPAWARTVWVRRAPLPLDAIASASRAPFAFRPPALRVVAFASSDGQGARHDADHIWRGLQTWADASDDVRLGLAVAARDGTCVLRGSIDDDAPVDPARSPCCFGPKVLSAWTLSGDERGHLDHRPRRRREPSCGASSDAYTLFLFPSDEASETLTMGAGRHAWARYPAGGGRWRQTGAERAAAAARRAVPIAASYFTTGHDFEGADGAEGAEEVPMRVPPLPASPSGAALLSFSLVNAAPEEGHTYSWRFEEDFEKPLVSHLVAALAPLVDARVEAQVLYHSPSRAATEAHATPQRRTNSPRRRAAFRGRGLEPRHVPRPTPSHARALRRVRPGREHVPTDRVARRRLAQPVERIRRPRMGRGRRVEPADVSGRRKNRGERGNREDRNRGDGNGHRGDCGRLATCRVLGRVGRDDNVGVRRAASRVVRASAGVADGEDEEKHPGMVVRSVSAGAAGFARWEVDVLVRRRAVERCARRRTRCRPWRRRREIFRSSTCPPGSPTRREALRAADAARDAAAEGRVEDAAAAARDAHVAAESAFFHPDIISLLYFPAEYTLAVYVPLFLPTAFPVLVGLMWDVRFFVRRRRCAAAFRERRDTKVE